MQLFRKCYRSFIILLLLLFFAACTASQRVVKTYEGPTLPEDELARLEVPEDIKIVQIDGIQQKTYLLDNLALTYSLLPGEHSIVYRYASIWARTKQSGDDTNTARVENIESDLRQVTMVFQPAQSYTFSFKQPSNKREAAIVAQQFSAAIVDANGRKVAEDSLFQPKLQPKTVVVSTPTIEGDGSVAAGATPVILAPGVGADSTTAVTGSDSLPDSLGQSRVVDAPPAVTAAEPVDAGLSRLDAIKVLWTKASADEKKEFLRWAFQ